MRVDIYVRSTYHIIAFLNRFLSRTKKFVYNFYILHIIIKWRKLTPISCDHKSRIKIGSLAVVHFLAYVVSTCWLGTALNWGNHSGCLESITKNATFRFTDYCAWHYEKVKSRCPAKVVVTVYKL